MLHPETLSDPIEISFVIPALNEESVLEKLLKSIRSQQTTKYVVVKEVIVIDGGSFDSTIEIAKTYGSKILHNKGAVSKSRNLGAASSTGNVLAFVDADCELPAEWMLECAKVLREKKAVAVGCAMALNPDNTWVERVWHRIAHVTGNAETTARVDWLATFNILVNKSAFEETGGFNETLLTAEDVDLGYRLSETGKLYRLDHCHVIHHGESKTLSEFYHREAWRGAGAHTVISEHYKNPRELASFAIPFVVVASALIGSTAIVLAILDQLLGTHIYPYGFSATLITGILTGVLPLAFVTIIKGVNPRVFLPAMLLVSIYSTARVIGYLKKHNRVDRQVVTTSGNEKHSDVNRCRT